MWIVGLTVIVMWAAGIIGWIINLVDVIQLAVVNSPLTTLFVVKAVGIFVAPIGVVCGLFF